MVTYGTIIVTVRGIPTHAGGRKARPYRVFVFTKDVLAIAGTNGYKIIPIFRIIIIEQSELFAGFLYCYFTCESLCK